MVDVPRRGFSLSSAGLLFDWGIFPNRRGWGIFPNLKKIYFFCKKG